MDYISNKMDYLTTLFLFKAKKQYYNEQYNDTKN